MRDDVHKRAPVPPKWRRHVKHVCREADRDSRSHGSALAAVLGDVQNEVTKKFVRKLLAIFGQGGALFDPLFGIRTSKEIGGSGFQMENSILENCRFRAATGQQGVSVVSDAIEQVIRERCESRGRAIESYLALEGGKDVRVAIAACHRALSAIDEKAIASRLVAGAVGSLSTRLPTFDFDEDLRGHAGRRK